MIIRVGIGALLLAALIAAFSLQPLPRPLTADLPAESFDGAAGIALLNELSTRYGVRRAGSPGDAALAARVRTELERALPTAKLQSDRFRADTPDGRRDLENVSATLPGQPGPSILIVAHRDALYPVSRAELTATVGLIMLARAAGQGRLRHSVQFVSTTAGSGGGLSGVTRIARTQTGSVAAALALGTLAAPRGQPAHVVPWSNSPLAAPLRLQRTVEAAAHAEGLRTASSLGLGRQLVRRGLPASVGEQAELNQGGIPTVLLSGSDSAPPAATAAVTARSFTAYGQAALRSLLALDAVGASVGPPQAGLVLAGQVLPAWAIRILLLTLLAPLAVAALVLGLSLYPPAEGQRRFSLVRSGHPLLAGAAWTAGCAVGPLITGLAAVALGRVGLAWPAVPAPYAGAAVHTGPGAWVAVVVLLAILLGTTAVARPFLTREASGRRRPTRIAVAFSVFGMLLVTVVVLLIVNPLAALLVLPALLAWPAAIAPLPMIGSLHRVALIALGALPILAAILTVISDLGVPALQVPWWLVLLVAGGHIAPFSLLLSSLVVGAFIATGLTLLPAPPARPPDPPEEQPALPLAAV